jgi:hypothetical protein
MCPSPQSRAVASTMYSWQITHSSSRMYLTNTTDDDSTGVSQWRAEHRKPRRTVKSRRSIEEWTREGCVRLKPVFEVMNVVECGVCYLVILLHMDHWVLEYQYDSCWSVCGCVGVCLLSDVFLGGVCEHAARDRVVLIRTQQLIQDLIT